MPWPSGDDQEVLTKHELQEPVTYPYAVDIEYTLYVENIGNVDVWIAEVINLLPVGINYIENTCGSTDLDCLTNAPSKLHYISQLDRQRVTWTFNPTTILVVPGQTKTISFSADAIIFEGNYWVDLLVSFDPYFPEKVYTWPTAVLTVVEVYTVEIIVDGVVVPNALTLWVQAEDGGVQEWNINFSYNGGAG